MLRGLIILGLASQAYASYMTKAGGIRLRSYATHANCETANASTTDIVDATLTGEVMHPVGRIAGVSAHTILGTMTRVNTADSTQYGIQNLGGGNTCGANVATNVMSCIFRPAIATTLVANGTTAGNALCLTYAATGGAAATTDPIPSMCAADCATCNATTIVKDAGFLGGTGGNTTSAVGPGRNEAHGDNVANIRLYDGVDGYAAAWGAGKAGVAGNLFNWVTVAQHTDAACGAAHATIHPAEYPVAKSNAINDVLSACLRLDADESHVFVCRNGVIEYQYHADAYCADTSTAKIMPLARSTTMCYTPSTTGTGTVVFAASTSMKILNSPEEYESICPAVKTASLKGVTMNDYDTAANCDVAATAIVATNIVSQKMFPADTCIDLSADFKYQHLAKSTGCNANASCTTGCDADCIFQDGAAGTVVHNTALTSARSVLFDSTAAAPTPAPTFFQLSVDPKCGFCGKTTSTINGCNATAANNFWKAPTLVDAAEANKAVCDGTTQTYGLGLLPANYVMNAALKWVTLQNYTGSAACVRQAEVAANAAGRAMYPLAPSTIAADLAKACQQVGAATSHAFVCDDNKIKYYLYPLSKDCGVSGTATLKSAILDTTTDVTPAAGVTDPLCFTGAMGGEVSFGTASVAIVATSAEYDLICPAIVPTAAPTSAPTNAPAAGTAASPAVTAGATAVAVAAGVAALIV